MKKIWNSWGILGILLMGFLPGCSEDGIGTKSLVNILLIDAPGDFEEVWIEILGVELLPSGSRGTENANWVNIPYLSANNNVRVSDLVDNERLLLGRREIQAGNISRIKLLLGDTFYIVKEGEEISMLPVNNLEQFLELEVDFQASAGLSYDLYIDFNLAKSVIPLEGEAFVLRPDIRAFTREGTAEISGSIFPNTEKPHIFAIHEQDTFATLTSTNGNFRLRGLPPADLQVLVQAPPDFLDTTFMVSARRDTLIQLPNIELRPQEGEITPEDGP